MSIKHHLAGWLLAAAAVLLPGSGQAALLGVVPQEPTIDFGAAGVIALDAATGKVTVSAVPAALLNSEPFLFGEFSSTVDRDIDVVFTVNSAGALVSSGNATQPGFRLVGTIDVNTSTGVVQYSGVLLEGSVTGFGFQDGGAIDDQFDLTVTLTGGTMRELFPTNALRMAITSEISAEYPTPFNGGFTTSFTALAKGVIGAGDPTPPPTGRCKIRVDASCSVDGGPYQSKCRISQYKSPKFWDWEERDMCGHRHNRYTYGLHGLPEPAWSRNRPQESTSVKFKYVVKNVGTVPVADLAIDDSFDTDVVGLPSTLGAGQSATVVRTESLRESIDDIVKVMARSGTYACMAKDTVVVREKLRDRRKHDDDRYHDKGRRGDD